MSIRNNEVRRTVDLSALVDPSSIAIIGASDRPNSLGSRSVSNVLEHSNFDGKSYLISKTKSEIAGHATFRSIRDVPGEVDVAMLVVPASVTLDTLRECAETDVKFAIVFTSGFGEMGVDGKAVEQEMLAISRQSGMRIYGPNSPGLCNLNKPLGMMFSPSFQVDQFPGPIGLATQGGGIGRCFIQSMEKGVGVGLWASTGNEVDLTVADFIRYMADADDITTIATAMEGIKDGTDFIDAVMYAAERNKPVIALKVGRSEYGAKAVASHTGSLSGAVEVNRAALRQAGVVEVDDLDELVDTAALFARKPPGPTTAVAVYGFSGGGCAMAADAVGASDMKLAEFTPETLNALENTLPAYAAISNPVDATSDILTRIDIGADSLLATAQDPNVGVVLYPFPCDYADLTGAIAEATVAVQRKTETPIVPIWMSDRLGPGYDALVHGGMVPVSSINKGALAVKRWLERGSNGPENNWRPMGPTFGGLPGQSLQTATEVSGKELLRRHGIAVPTGRITRSADEAADFADTLDRPAVLKVVSAQITHKSDVGGVLIGLAGSADVARGFDTIVRSVAEVEPDATIEGILVEEMADDGVDVLVGVTQDPVFGPVMTFGLGGVYVELFADVSRRLLPLTEHSARQMIAEPKCSALLTGLRGQQPMDTEALVDLLLNVSRLIEANTDIHELEMNPVRVHPVGRGVTALDVVLVRATIAEEAHQ